jgi:hypothetical protein
MSIFDESAVQTNAATETPASLYETLVGEGKKFKSPEDLAKAKLESDRFIEQLKEEPKQLREDLDRLAEENRLLKEIAKQTDNGSTAKPEQNTTASVSPEIDLEARIRETLKKTSEEDKRQSNINQVSNTMLEAYGTQEKAAEVLRQKAVELGVGVEFLQDVAAKSPKAFFQTIGVNEVARSQQTNAGSTVNSAALGQTGVKANTYQWYQQLRKDNPKVYNSPKIQNQMMKDALAYGEAFYK